MTVTGPMTRSDRVATWRKQRRSFRRAGTPGRRGRRWRRSSSILVMCSIASNAQTINELRMIPGAVGHNYSEDTNRLPVLGEATPSYHTLHLRSKWAEGRICLFKIAHLEIWAARICATWIAGESRFCELNQEHRQKCDDGCAVVDYKLPCVREAKKRTRNCPDHHGPSAGANTQALPTSREPTFATSAKSLLNAPGFEATGQPMRTRCPKQGAGQGKGVPI